ncbi:MAG: hypothetical protein ACKVOR_06500 [Flavobacteriales bacterium]
MQSARWNAQPTLELKYAYLHSPQFDLVFQTFNTARPWHEHKLIPLTHGYGANVGWNFKLSTFRQLHAIPQLAYIRFGTLAENGLQSNEAGFHAITISTSFRYHPRALLKGIQTCGPLGPRWFLTTTPGFSSFLPFARMDDEPWHTNEDETYRPISTAFNLSMGTGYHVSTIWKFILTAEVSSTWYPSFRLHDFAEAVNGHNITSLNNEIQNLFLFNASLRITYAKGKTNWWDRPREGDKS